jgi:hypothetical protein
MKWLMEWPESQPWQGHRPTEFRKGDLVVVKLADGTETTVEVVSVTEPQPGMFDVVLDFPRMEDAP